MVQSTKKKYRYVEGDVSRIYFNHRILQETQKPIVPLLERLSFLGIYSNDLDKFFRVGMASPNKILESAKVSTTTARMIKKTIRRINKLNREYNIEYGNAIRDVLAGLRKYNVRVLDEMQFSEEQKAFLETFRCDGLNGSINPIWPSEIDDISILEDNCIYPVMKRIEEVSHETKFAIIKISDRVYRRLLKILFLDNCESLMYLSNVVRYCLSLIFIGLKKCTYEVYPSKFTRGAEVEADDEADYGAMEHIVIGVNNRKRGEAIRMVYDKDAPADSKKKVIKCLHVKELDTLLVAGRYQNHGDLTSFPALGHEKLNYPKWPRVLGPEFLSEESISDLIRQKDRFVHVPYHSLNGYVRILREAASCPEVKEIKTTLHHLARDSKMVKASVYAVQNGKKATAVVELLARFGEESNIKWSERMQEEGVNVIFGMEGLKIHSKLLHITTTEGNLVCVGTGNFHEGSAKTYTDYPVMATRPRIANGVEKVFYFIDRPFSQVRFRELMVPPDSMKTRIIRMLDNGIRNVLVEEETWVKVKINHAADPDIVNELCATSQAGVKIDLLLCDNCSLVPGVRNMSENIKAVGIVDRYLEHSRVLIFCNGRRPEYYLGSTDWLSLTHISEPMRLTFL